MPLIIFVDDHQDDANLFQLAINEISNQCVVTLAEGSAEFFDLLERVTPQFIFLDVIMPGEGGISCLKKIRAQRKYDQIPIIMYSVSPSHMDVCFKEKADFYIKKPDTYDEIVACIKKVLIYSASSSKSAHREHFVIN